MKVLLTGFTAAQCNPESHRKSYNYMGTLWDTIRSDEHEVFWQDPRLDMSQEWLETFDRVVVGIAPLSGLGSNRAYGALSVIERLWGSEKLVLLVDAPEPGKIQTALQATVMHPEILCKPFFSYRKEFQKAAEKDENARLMQAVKYLAEEQWPLTLVPRLPWHDRYTIASWFPAQAQDSIRALSFDGSLMDKSVDDLPPVKRELRWAVERGTSEKWSGLQVVSWPTLELTRNFRVDTNRLDLVQLAGSAGLLVQPARDGTWWTPRYAMSMQVGTPVFSRWEETCRIGDAWAELPGTFETRNETERTKIAWEQREMWLDYTRSTADSLKDLWGVLGLEQAKRRGRRKK